MDLLAQLPEELRARVQAVVQQFPPALEVFAELHEWHSEGHKKRKIAAEATANSFGADGAFAFHNISMILPERKKVNLLLSESAVGASYATGPVSEAFISVPKARIGTVLCLHVPDKAKPQWNLTFCTNGEVGPDGQLVKVAEPFAQVTIQDALVDPFLDNPPAKYKGKKLRRVLLELVASSFARVVESEEGLCVAAHRGSQEGLLYLLDDCLFYGFKKPMLLFPVGVIESISYSSITRLTFNLDIRLSQPVNGATSFEFSMIDHSDFDAINQYVAANGLDNQSMSEARKAKVSTVKPEYSSELSGLLGTPSTTEAGPDGATGQPNESDEEQDEDYNGGSGEESGSGSESGSDDSDSDDSDDDEDDEDDEDEDEDEDVE